MIPLFRRHHLYCLLFHFWFYWVVFWIFFLIRVVKSLSNLSFQKTPLSFVSLFYCFSVLCLIISALIFTISFLLPNLRLLFSSFSSSLRHKVRLFTWVLTSPLMYAFITTNFSCNTAFAASHKSWCVVFHFSLCQDSFKIPFWFSLWPNGCSRLYYSTW